MANLVTTFRFFLLFVLVALAYQDDPYWLLACTPLVILVFILDGVDGWIARRRGESSLFGAIFDIAVDRVVENVLWIVLADLGVVPVWVAILFVTRGILVDSLRSEGTARGESPFGMMSSRLGRMLVSGRPMRLAYGVVKGAAFAWLLFLLPWPGLAPEWWAEWRGAMTLTGDLLVYAAAILCVVRGLPVILEVAFAEGLFTRHASSSPSGR
ncbi:MAG: CDP-alcohol phosphatidyltransferase family protein [Gammaproteobacteria bacterium]|nr:CDP-alcohol phosphatidyltransferase family protein [Gammaproteobacteria bacterium]